MNNQLSAKNN